MFAHLLPQLSDRIYEPERSKGESLVKLVSSMLVQMTRRLIELEFYKATQHTKQTSSASATTAPSSAPSGDSHPYGRAIRLTHRGNYRAKHVSRHRNVMRRREAIRALSPTCTHRRRCGRTHRASVSLSRTFPGKHRDSPASRNQATPSVTL